MSNPASEHDYVSDNEGELSFDNSVDDPDYSPSKHKDTDDSNPPSPVLPSQHKQCLEMCAAQNVEVENTLESVRRRLAESDPTSPEPSSTPLPYKRKICTTSGVWNHFTWNVHLKEAKCNHCNKKYAYSSSTTNILGHIKSAHPRLLDEPSTSQESSLCGTLKKKNSRKQVP